jgi:hypothetical protein
MTAIPPSPTGVAIAAMVSVRSFVFTMNNIFEFNGRYKSR